MDDFETVRQSLQQYQAWGIREGWTMNTFGLDALDRLEARVKELEAVIQADRNSYTAALARLREENERLREAAMEHLAACMSAGRTQDNLRQVLAEQEPAT